MPKIAYGRGTALAVLLGLALSSAYAQDLSDPYATSPEQYRGQVTRMRILILSEDIEATLKDLRGAILETRRVHSIGDGRAWARLKRTVKKLQTLVDEGAELAHDSAPPAQASDPGGDDDPRLKAADALAARGERVLARLRTQQEMRAPSA